MAIEPFGNLYILNVVRCPYVRL